MLKELSMKKDKILMDRFKQNQAMALATSSINLKKDSTLKTGSTAYLGPKPGKLGVKSSSKDQGIPVKVFVKFDESSANDDHDCGKEYELGKYKHTCQTCKIMRDYQEKQKGTNISANITNQ
jgi:hypothetical protein